MTTVDLALSSSKTNNSSSSGISSISSSSSSNNNSNSSSCCSSSIRVVTEVTQFVFFGIFNSQKISLLYLNPSQFREIYVLQAEVHLVALRAGTKGDQRTSARRPFPSYCEPHYESEAKCKTFHMKIRFVCK